MEGENTMENQETGWTMDMDICNRCCGGWRTEKRSGETWEKKMKGGSEEKVWSRCQGKQEGRGVGCDLSPVFRIRIRFIRIPIRIPTIIPVLNILSMKILTFFQLFIVRGGGGITCLYLQK